MKYLVFLLIIVIVILLVLFYKKNKSVDLVISRYNEDIDWLTDLDKYRRVVVYNKGQAFEYPDSRVEIINLPNVGKCDHTYLYHIIHNYENLAGVTIFLSGSCFLEHKKHQTEHTIGCTLKTKTGVCVAHDAPGDIRTFQLDGWKTSDPKNLKLNNEVELKLSPERPFGVWYTINFGEEFSSRVVYYGIFSATSEEIRSRPKAFYEKLCRYVDDHSNPEVGHYLERSWYSIFNKT